MPQLNDSSCNEVEPGASVDEPNNETNSEETTYKRKLRTRSKNAESEAPKTPEKKPVKKPAKRKLSEKKTAPAKSAKSRLTKKKQEEQQSSVENSETNITVDIKQEALEQMHDEGTDEEDMEEGEIPSSIAAESKTYYSCKLCHKDFTSAFILCLHLQIHQKVANNPITESDSSSVADKECRSETVKVEKDLDVDANTNADEVEKEATDIKPVGVINKNFVENLKKNLSLAMARNNL